MEYKLKYKTVKTKLIEAINVHLHADVKQTVHDV